MALLDNLVSYWKLNESSGNAADSVGSNTLTNVNSASYAPALIANGIDFGATNTNKYLNNTAAVVAAGGACSISLWVKMETEITSSYQQPFVIVEQVNKTEQGIRYEYNGGTRRLLFNRVKFGTGTDQVVYNVALGTSGYHHLVYTYDGTTITGYFDGVSIGTQAASGVGSVDPTTTGTRIGTNYAGSGAFLQGLVDEVGIWSRALTAGEVTQLYASGGGLRFFTISDSITNTEVTATAVKQLPIIILDTVSSSDFIVPFRKIWNNVAKNVSTWINQNKS